MSYDIHFGVKVAGVDSEIYAVIGEPELCSPTYNIGQILRQSTGWDFEQGEWYKVSEVLPMIERGIHELAFNSDKYKPLEPINGWGNVTTAYEALNSIMKWLTHDLKWSWNADIPLECIYICW